MGSPSPPRPASGPVSTEDWPGRDLGLPAEGPGALSAIGPRIAARAIDAAAWFGAALVLGGIEAAVRAATGAKQSASGSSDPLSTVLGLVIILVTLVYDPLTTAIWGAPIGKLAAGLRVVSVDDGSPSSVGVVGGRYILQLVLWSVGLAPGIADLVAGVRDRNRRTWHDRALSTVVVRNPTPRHRGGAPLVSARSLPAPWSSLVSEAQAAQRRLEQSTAVIGAGPVHDRLVDAHRQILECVARCAEVAARGAQLQSVAAGVDVDAIRSRHAAALADHDAHPNDLDAAQLATALEGELGSAERLHRLGAETETTLRRLVAQLNDAVNNAAEVAFASDPAGFDGVVEQLESLRLGLAEAHASASLNRLDPP